MSHPGRGPRAPRLPSLATLNQLAPAAFAQAVRPLFEAADPLAEALLAERPFASYAELIDRAQRIAQALPTAQQVEIVNAHPRIGERPDVVRAASSLSYREQGYDTEDPAQVGAVYAELERLNRAYEQRFGFRFVVFVNRRPKSVLVDVLRTRLEHDREHELRTALDEMFAIARDRVQDLEIG